MRFTRYSEPSDAEIDALHTSLCDCGAPVERFGDTCLSCLAALTLDLEETLSVTSLNP